MFSTLEKKAKIILLSCCIVSWTLMAIIMIEAEKRLQNIYNKAVEITRCDSVNIKVTNKFHSHGTYFFNNSFKIRIYKIEQPVSLHVSKLLDKLELPFYLNKDANNDTLWLIDNKETYFGVFRKDRDFVKFNVELPDTIYRE